MSQVDGNVVVETPSIQSIYFATLWISDDAAVRDQLVKWVSRVKSGSSKNLATVNTNTQPETTLASRYGNGNAAIYNS